MPLNVRPLGYACISGSVNAARALLMYEGVDIDERLAEGNRHLHIAAYAARTEMVRFLLQEAGSLSVNERTDAGFTPLMLAAVAGDALSMRLLLQSGADYTVPMPNGRTLLEGIVATQNVELARALLFSADNINVDETTDPGNTPLCTAVRGDNLELAALLLTYNADPNILEDDPIAESPLHIALTRDNLEMVRLLFGYGANIMLRDEFGFDALALATLVNSAGLVEYLLSLLDRPLISIIGEDGDTPMFYALANNRLAAFSGFLNADNIDWSVVNPRGQTLLHVAIHMDHHAIAMALIERMSDATMTHQDQAGDTALHEACRHSNGIRYVEALMRDGRLLEALGLRNAAYQTPIDIAREKGNMALVEKLQSFS